MRYIITPNNLQFSINLRHPHGTGIQERPDVFPPEEEVRQQRYEYFESKERIPTNVFLHFLLQGRRKVSGEHSGHVLLEQLPKKLNETLRASAGKRSAADVHHPDLHFGWGVHIIDGPSHASLGFLLAIGVSITLIVSLVILGAAKTQEQAFGIGSYLLAILTCIMAALYFRETE